MRMLEVNGATVAREGLPICRHVSLAVPAGEITVLLGANGAGKTTLLEGISGVLPLAGGDVVLAGTSMAGQRREERARRGLAHVEQGRTVFRELTVDENLRLPAGADPVDAVLERFPSLQRRRHTKAVHLSGGEQQMLVIARALCASPQVLLLDELSLGLAPVIVNGLMADISALAESGLAILLVEQFAALALRVGSGAYVLTHGEVTFAGRCEELSADPERLRAAYLGEL